VTVAIIGANGFIGGRAVEMLHLEGAVDIRPVVRSYASLARLSRFELDWKVADARDESALRRALEGCEYAIHAVMGDPRTILGTLRSVYRAADACGVRRLIYLSTAVVHGQAPTAGTDERSPLHTDQPLAYNNAKARAERRLLALRARGKMELVMLRPCIVFGPRSRWIASLARELLEGRAYFAGQSSGICNTIYVDNVVQAILCALRADAQSVDGEAFLIGDAEHVTWGQFSAVVAKALGKDVDDIPCLPVPEFKRTRAERLEALRTSRPVQALLPFIPRPAKRTVKAALKALWAKTSDWALPPEPGPVVTQEMALLHSCAWQLPMEKARQRLGYEPKVSFAEGMRRSIGWLKFAGYPVIAAPRE